MLQLFQFDSMLLGLVHHAEQVVVLIEASADQESLKLLVRPAMAASAGSLMSAGSRVPQISVHWN